MLSCMLAFRKRELATSCKRCEYALPTNLARDIAGVTHIAIRLVQLQTD
jgi:hypothetical protein